MDTEIKETSIVKVKKGRKNEKKKKNENSTNDGTIGEVCRQMSKLAEEEAGGSASSTDNEELVNAINYNTITSLAALKDIIQGDGNDTPETDSFFQHYFMNHCNNLSSRNSASNAPFAFPERRRLSQCMEEDEDDDKKESDPPPSAVSSELGSEVASLGSLTTLSRVRCSSDVGEQRSNSINEMIAQDKELSEEPDSTKRTVMGAKHKFLVTTTERTPPPPPPPLVERALRSQVHNAHTVHFGTKGAEEQRPSVRSIFTGNNLHRDKNYFDSSLIEIRSTVDGVPASSEDIWVKRAEPEPKKEMLPLKEEKAAKVVVKELPKEVEKKLEIARLRSGTWGAQTTGARDFVKKPHTQSRKEKEVRRSSDDRRQKREQRLDAAVTRSTQSVGERKSRTSNDDGQPEPMYQQTIHGTSGVSRRPALFDLFKSKPKPAGDAKKQPSIMKQVKAAVQNMTKSTATKESSSKSESTAATPTSSAAAPVTKTRDGSAHPHAGSEARYYHTVTASATRRPSAMAKVRDIFRSRASVPGHNAAESAERRKRAIAHQQYSSGKSISFYFYLNEL